MLCQSCLTCIVITNLPYNLLRRAWGPFFSFLFVFLYCLSFCIVCIFVFLNFCLFAFLSVSSFFSFFSFFLSFFLFSFLLFCLFVFLPYFLFVFLSFCHHYHNHGVNIYYHTNFSSNLTIFQCYHTFHHKPLPILPAPPQANDFERPAKVLRGRQIFGNNLRGGAGGGGGAGVLIIWF